MKLVAVEIVKPGEALCLALRGIGRPVFPDFLQRFLRERILSADVLQYPAGDLIEGIILAEPVKAEETFRSLRAERRPLKFFARCGKKLQFITHILKSVIKLSFGQGSRYRTVNILTDPAAVRRLAVLFSHPLAVVFLFAFRLLYDGQTVFTAQPVGNIPHVLVVFLCTVILDPVHEGDRVHNEVIMNVTGLIKVSAYKYLIPVAPDLLRKLYADLLGKLRCDLAFGKGLIAVIGNRSVLFPVGSFDPEHIFSRRFRGAMNAPDKLPLVCGILTSRVGDNVTERIRIRVFRNPDHFRLGCLIRILGIQQNLADISFDSPDGCGCHYV